MLPGKSPSARLLLLASLLVVVVAIAAGVYIVRRGPALPVQGSPRYEQMSRAFYRGLAALEVGLLDNARQEFTRSTEIVAEEPAAWADLGLTLMRLGELDAAADPVNQALSLAPDNPDVALLAGRMEIARGHLDEGLAHLRRAVQLDPRGLRARYAVAEEVERGTLTPASRREAQALYDELLALAPDNLAILVERARLAAIDDIPLARDAMRRIEPFTHTWPPEAVEQFDAVNRAIDAPSLSEAVRGLTRLRNVLARVPAYRESLAALRTPPELIAEPFTRFVALQSPTSTPSPPDTEIAFTRQPVGSAARVTGVAVAVLDAAARPTVVEQAALPLDWNRDFRTDLVIADSAGLMLLEQDAAGTMRDVTARASAGVPVACGCYAAWAADVEMDGDLDLIVGLNTGPTMVLRNNGDGTWQPLQTFARIAGARAFAWGDIDGDADPDAVFVDANRVVHVLLNRQAGSFDEVPAPSRLGDVLAVTIADIDGNGALDLVTLAGSGHLAASTWRGQQWASSEVGTWGGFNAASGAGAYRVFAADLDNNGGLDLLVSGPGESRIWLADERMRFALLPAVIPAAVFGIADITGDGRLDLAAVAAGQPALFVGGGRKAYHWKAIRARAQETAGDQRINSFGVGGEISVRSGLLVQKQVLNGLPAHFGLGERAAIDVARIVWPNGVPQAEFDPPADDTAVAEQRLKGSCPWVFAWNGERVGFVTDFLWRSPLGLRINAQDTAGTAQTEDWIRIGGDQLVARDNAYDVRITAELWETHFFDHVSLRAVDHPEGTEVFVDERFSATKPQDTAIRAVQMLRPVREARDDAGRDVTARVNARDGRYLATFPRGEYQGIAPDHFVEFDAGDGLPRDRLVLIAQGWVYPTDSSINVAIGQRRVDQPRGLSLEAQEPSGAWRTIDPDLGFPAGKNKTLVIALDRIGQARRLRLRTNLEVYWDALTFASVADAAVKTQRLALSAAELRYRGFSQTTSPRGEAPETPDYGRLANTTPRWRDLEGYYTRFGDVRELLAAVDDRYVIMNAGDEMRLRFAAPPAPAAGWRRDFVLVGDGWEKDGDYNTGYSNTVTPLPTHARSEYVAAGSSLTLEADPVYQQHRDDWDKFHTRYVTADRFLKGLAR